MKLNAQIYALIGVFTNDHSQYLYGLTNFQPWVSSVVIDVGPF